MDNPEKLATQGTQDEEKHNTICVGHHYTRTNTKKLISSNNAFVSNTII
jgi:hypothetical protein